MNKLTTSDKPLIAAGEQIRNCAIKEVCMKRVQKPSDRKQSPHIGNIGMMKIVLQVLGQTHHCAENDASQSNGYGGYTCDYVSCREGDNNDNNDRSRASESRETMTVPEPTTEVKTVKVTITLKIVTTLINTVKKWRPGPQLQ